MRHTNVQCAVLICLTVLFAVQTVSIAQTKSKKVDVLKQYSICSFNDGLKIKDVQRLDEDLLRSRGVDTKDGRKEVTRIGSFYVLVGYPKMSPFANIRPEQSQLVKDMFESDKNNVVENLKYIISTSRENESDAPIKNTINGFEHYSADRKSLVGSTLGISVLFNDTDNTITTIYFFNAEPKKRNFQTIEEWKNLRDRFLNSYTQCINTNLGR